jgi:hypothetical protein
MARAPITSSSPPTIAASPGRENPRRSELFPRRCTRRAPSDRWPRSGDRGPWRQALSHRPKWPPVPLIAGQIRRSDSRPAAATGWVRGFAGGGASQGDARHRAAGAGQLHRQIGRRGRVRVWIDFGLGYPADGRHEKRQRRDIDMAHAYWQDYKRSKRGPR